MQFTWDASNAGSKPTAAASVMYYVAFVFFCKSLGVKVTFSRRFIAQIEALEEYCMGVRSLGRNILFYIEKRAFF